MSEQMLEQGLNWFVCWGWGVGLHALGRVCPQMTSPALGGSIFIPDNPALFLEKSS